MLRKYIQEKKEKWDDYLDTCSFAYNTSKHESTKFTPFEIMFGRKAILPLDLDAGVHQGPCNETEVTICSQETEIQQKESQHKALLEEVQKNIISAQKKQKEQYDKKHNKAVFYSVDTQVLKKDFRKKKKRRQTTFPMGWTLFDHKESRKRFLRATIMWKRSCYHNSKS